jgi:hypothetical protein
VAVLIAKLRGMSPELKAKLLACGARTSDQLLDLARTPARRIELAEAVGVEPSAILTTYTSSWWRPTSIGSMPVVRPPATRWKVG